MVKKKKNMKLNTIVRSVGQKLFEFLSSIKQLRCFIETPVFDASPSGVAKATAYGLVVRKAGVSAFAQFQYLNN